MLRRIPVLATLLLAACGNGPDPRRNPPKVETSASASASAAPAAPPQRVLFDMVQALPGCDVDHRGPLFDMGTDAMVGRYGWARGVPAGVTPVEHDGSTWARFTDRKFQVSFTLLEPTPIFVSARAVSYGAKNISVTLDDAPLGTLVLARDLIKSPQTGTTTLPVDPGLHTLTFRFYGRVRDGDAFADIDWIRVGIPDDSTATYGPPTLRDTIAPAAALAGVPHRSLALRAPGSVRCALRFPRGGRLRTAVGLQGAGEGDAEIRVLRDGKKPEVIRTVHVEGGEKAAWVDVDIPLAPYDEMVGALELRAAQAPRGGRVLFGDPAVVLPQGSATAPAPARAVIVVILDGVTRAELPPWSAAPVTTVPTLTDLAQSGTVFDQHRAPATVVAASVASLLTGLPPQGHGVTDAGARLPAGLGTIAGVARDASVRTAMFTGVPYTFRAFGFGAAWEKYVEHPPSSGAAATAPIDDALAWITETGKNAPDARLLAVVHARGGHPPWDVTSKELSTAGPPEYTGLVEPRSAAQKIARMRRSKRAQVVTEADRMRIRSLEQIALAGQDRALGALIASLRTSGLWDSTLLIVTGDVSSGADELFADGADLKEPALTLPLYAHFPGGMGAGRRLGDPTEMADLARTALAALGLPPPKQALGRDLARIVADLDVASLAPQVAVLDDRYAARWGDLVLSGKYPKPPALCDLALDATCAFNRRDTMPIAAGAIFRGVMAQDLATHTIAAKREPATIDGDTSAALTVWGATD
ncbi:MAG: sulfatase-like hydrolase/transferase [Minicystis sp.]